MTSVKEHTRIINSNGKYKSVLVGSSIRKKQTKKRITEKQRPLWICAGGGECHMPQLYYEAIEPGCIFADRDEAIKHAHKCVDMERFKADASGDDREIVMPWSAVASHWRWMNEENIWDDSIGGITKHLKTINAYHDKYCDMLGVSRTVPVISKK